MLNVTQRYEKEDDYFTRGLLNFLRRSGHRIAAEAEEITKDLKRVVDVMENHNYYLTVGYRNKENSQANPNSGKLQIPTVSSNTQITNTTKKPIEIPTTTEEDSNAILEDVQSLIKSTRRDSNKDKIEPDFPEETTLSSEITTLTTSPPKQEAGFQSAFSSMMLRKIYEATRKMNNAESGRLFANKPENFQRFKRQIETAEALTTESPILQQSPPVELDQCISKWDLQQHKSSEKKHLDGLQKELEKMEELISILQEQQHILDNMSDIDKKYYEYLNHSMRAGNIEEQRRLVELLEVLNSKLSNNSTNILNGSDSKSTDFLKHMEEVKHLKSEVEQLKMVVEKLPTHSQEIEKKLSREIEKQKFEIFEIRKTLRHLTSMGKILTNGSMPRASENSESVDPNYIQEQIKEIQGKIDELMAKGNQQDPILGEEQQNPETTYLLSLKKEVEHLRNLVDRSLQLQQEIPYSEVSEEDVYKLENEEKQLLSVKRVIEEMLNNKMMQKHMLDQNEITGNDFLLGEPRHQVKVPHLFRISATPRLSKLGKPAKVVLANQRDENLQAEHSDKPTFHKGRESRLRSSDSNDLRKLLKELDTSAKTDDDSDEIELQNKISELQRQLKAAADKNRKKIDMEAQIRFLEQRVKTLENVDFQSKSLSDDDDKTTLKFLKRMLQQLQKSDREIDETDTERELRKLAEAINKLRPKDNDLSFDTESKNDASTAQFQLMLNKLIAQQNAAPRPAQSAPFSPQQMDFLINKLAPQYQTPTFPNVPFAPTLAGGRYIDYQQNFPPPSPTFPSSNNLFRDYQKNFAPNQGGYTGINQQQLVPNPEQSGVDVGPYGKQKIEDLKQQIYSLQGAISNLDNPNYVKKPEDEETIYKLEQQISNLKNIVSGLNQYSGDDGGNVEGNYRGGNAFPAQNDAPNVPGKTDVVYGDKPRIRRDIVDGEVDTERFMDHAANFLENLMPREEEKLNLHQRSSESYGNLHKRLEELEKQLGRTDL